MSQATESIHTVLRNNLPLDKELTAEPGIEPETSWPIDDFTIKPSGWLTPFEENRTFF